ncbi:MAG: Gldg family protein [Polyangiaceae bacterium]|nr:Gldg family protein [Polyangiaceae bacterium]
MALTERGEPSAESAPPASPAPRAEPEQREPAPPGGRPAPVWLVPLYVAGLVLVFIGERVIGEIPGWHSAFTGLGLAAVAVATALRFAPRFRAGGERRQMERLLAALSLLGLLALALYFATTDAGAAFVHLDSLSPDGRERALGVLTVGWLALLGLAVLPMLFAEGALLPMRRAERPESRRVRAAAASGAVLALAALYGALFVYAASGSELRADYSYFKTSRPSDSTRKIAASLTTPVKVVAFFPEVSEIKSEVERYLRELGRGLPTLQIEVKDRLLVPKLARDLRVSQDGTIVLAKGDTQETLTIGTEPDAARPKLKTLDRDFQERLLKLVRARRTAYLTTGHGELSDSPNDEPSGRSSSVVRLLLEKQNYLVKNLGVGQGLATDVPDDAALVIVLGPSQPFTPEELASLRRYAARGGHLLLALDPDALPAAGLALGAAPAASGAPALAGSSAPPAASGSAPPQPPSATGAVEVGAVPEPALARSLEALAGLVGLAFSPAELANDDPRYHVRRRSNESDRTQLVTSGFSSHASVSTLSRSSARGAAVFVFGAGSLERASGSSAKVDFTVRSMPGTFADPNRDYRLSPGEQRATFNLAAAVTAPATAAPPAPAPAKQGEKPAPPELRAFVVADADAFSDLVLSQAMTNQVLFVDAVRWLGGEESFAGQVNTEEDKPIEHTKQKDLVWFYSTIFGAPALVLGLGLAVSRRARRRSGGKAR